MKLILCGVVESSCLLTHNIVPHISSHGLPYHKTMKKYENSQSMVIFRLLLRKFATQTWFCICPQYLFLLHIVFEYIPDVHDQRKMLVLPNQLLCFGAFHIGLILCLYPAKLMSSTYTGKNNPFSLCTNKHSQLKTFTQPYFNKIFSNCLSHIVPAKGWPYRFRSRRTTGSSILDHDFGHLCRDRRIHMYIPILDFSIILEHLPFLLGYKLILRLLLVHRNLAVWIWYTWPLLPSFVKLMILAPWILHKIQNHLSQCHLEVQLDLCIFGSLSPIRNSSNDRSPSMMRSLHFYLLFLLHQSRQICFWLWFCPTPESFSSFSHSLSTAAFAAGIFIAWGIGVNLWTKL